MEFNVKDHCILYGYRGSIAHNLYVPPEDKFGTDDRDFMGVCIPPIECYLGLEKFDHKEYWEGVDDIVVYDFRKFIKLLVKSNPNVLGFLWNDISMYKIISPLGKKLIQHRHLFSTKQAYKSFVGYAKSQLHKMTRGSTNGYMGAKRKELVNEFGYDTKNAAHLIRLLTMGVEFLNTGRMYVFRTEDRDFLLDIKRGKYSLEDIKYMSAILFEKAELANSDSNLPDKVDHEEINKLMIAIYKERFNIKYA